MLFVLAPHPDSRCPAVSRIEVEAARPAPDLLALRYVVSGDMAAIRLPAPAAPARADGLWRRSCFEAFLQPGGGPGYCELNLSPSTEWAAYRFAGYRNGMSELGDIAAPRIETRMVDAVFELEAELQLDGLAEAPWRIGLSAVIESVDGDLSYWALAHPPGQADFHHAAGFAYDLPAMEVP